MFVFVDKILITMAYNLKIQICLTDAWNFVLRLEMIFWNTGPISFGAVRQQSYIG